MQATKSLTIVVPALNESSSINDTYLEIMGALRIANISDYEIIFIDDASTDDTFAIMEGVSRQNPKVVCVQNKTNLGLGGSYKKGIHLAQNEYYMLVPGDNAWGGDSLQTVFSKIGVKDMVIPYIVTAGDKGLARKFLSSAFTTFVNILFGLNIRYYNGIVVHRLQRLKSINIRTDSFAYQAEALVQLLKAGVTYVECGLDTLPRSDGKSKALRISNIFKVFLAIMSLRFRMSFYALKDDRDRF